MIKRVIFDIDNTLLEPNYSQMPIFLKKYSTDYNFINGMHSILSEYEKSFKRYTKKDLLDHLNQYTNSPLNEEFLTNLFEYNKSLPEQDMEEVDDVLTYLKQKYELVVLSNWFKDVQISKLKKLDILKYFDEIYAGDEFLKPYPESYAWAIGNHRPEECIMIGDSLEMDVIGPIKNGLQAIYYTNGKDETHKYPQIKKLSDLKKIL